MLTDVPLLAHEQGFGMTVANGTEILDEGTKVKQIMGMVPGFSCSASAEAATGCSTVKGRSRMSPSASRPTSL